MYEWLHAQAHDLENWNCLKACVFFVIFDKISVSNLIICPHSEFEEEKKKVEWQESANSKPYINVTL